MDGGVTVHVVNSEPSLQSLLGLLRAEWATHKYLRVTVKTGKARSMNQNDIAHVWFEQLARELKDHDALGWKCYCKLHHGVPILRAEDADFREMYDGALKGLRYEQKLMVMRSLPVTSLMTKAQLSAFLEAVQKDFFDNHGVTLEFPEGEQ
jgi:hypothetical protein